MGKIVLYIHGMGGGGDSRIPSILADIFSHPEGSQAHESQSNPDFQCHPERSEGVAAGKTAEVKIVVRTYDFDPDVAAEQIAGWVEELKPELVIGESLGSLQALRIKGVPHLFVSPSLNAPLYFSRLAFLALVPGVTWILDRIYRPKEGDRQKLHFTYRVLRKYRKHRKNALDNSISNGSDDYFYAFFGKNDHYRKSGIVSLKTWKKYFGKTYSVYNGTHFMEDEYVRKMLAPAVCNVLYNKKKNKNV